MPFNSTPVWSHDRAQAFEALRSRVKGVLQHFGVPDSLTRDGDYTVQGDYLGSPEVVAFIGNLELLRLKLSTSFSRLFRNFQAGRL